MTAIAGLVHEGRVYIGGDSAGTGGYMRTIRADAKVFRNGPYVFGFAGSFRMGQLLHHALKPPPPEGNLERHMVTTFVDAIRGCLKEGGWALNESGRDSAAGGVFLVGTAGRLFRVDTDFQVGEPADGWSAIGAGEEPVLGVLHATRKAGMAPKARLKLALEAAAYLNNTVAPPFVIRST